jgi:hypothetical protein
VGGNIAVITGDNVTENGNSATVTIKACSCICFVWFFISNAMAAIAVEGGSVQKGYI